MKLEPQFTSYMPGTGGTLIKIQIRDRCRHTMPLPTREL